MSPICPLRYLNSTMTTKTDRATSLCSETALLPYHLQAYSVWLLPTPMGGLCKHKQAIQIRGHLLYKRLKRLGADT
jgi:hypothetical protein